MTTSKTAIAAPSKHGAFEWRTEAALWIVVATWASTWIALKDAFDYIAPLAFLLIRFVLMCVLAFSVLAVQARRGNATWAIRRADLPLLIASGLSGYTCYQISAMLGLDRSSVFTLSLLVAMSPLFTMMMLGFLGEKSSVYGWIGLAVAAVGVVVFLSDKRSGGDSLLGAGLSLCAGLSMAVYGIVHRPLTRTYPRETSTAYCLLFGTIPMVFVCGRSASNQQWSNVPVHVWLGLAYLVVFPVYIAYQLWNYAISRRGAGPVSAYNLIVPILSGVLSAIIFHERFGSHKIAGAALALVGLLIPKLWSERGSSQRQARVSNAN